MISDNIDTLLPPDMAVQAETTGQNKVKMPFAKTLVLAILAGAFIALGADFFTVVAAGSPLSWGMTRLIAGLAFSLGLVLVVVGGAELFTGNNLIIMAWADKKVTTLQLLRNWAIVFVGNWVGALFVALLVFYSRQYLFDAGVVGVQALNIAKAKCELGFVQAVALGIGCNILVCLAVWLCYSIRSSAGKILCIVFPITAFVTLGFEHSIANMYFIPEAIFMLHYGDAGFLATVARNGINYGSVNWQAFLLQNLLPVTIGNMIGGAGLVGLVYWFVYLRHRPAEKAA